MDSTDPVVNSRRARWPAGQIALWASTLIAFASVPPVIATCVDDGTCIFIERRSFPKEDWEVKCTALVLGNGAVSGACGADIPGAGEMPNVDVSPSVTAFRRTAYLFPDLDPFNDSNSGRTHLIFVDHILVDGTSYDPSTQGALAGFDYGEARRRHTVGVNTHAALRQGGVVYRSRHFIGGTPDPIGSFQFHEALCLRAEDFWDENSDPNNIPDFSASGGPIKFGYQGGSRADTVSNGAVVLHDFDDLRLVLYNEDNSNCEDPPPPSPPQPELKVTVVTLPQPLVWEFGAAHPYEITVTNLSEVTATAVSLGEIVPIKTTFQPDMTIADWICDPGPGEGSFCTVEVGDLAPGQQITVDFSVMVDDGTPEEWEIFDEAFVDSFAALPASLAPILSSGLDFEREKLSARGRLSWHPCFSDDEFCISVGEILTCCLSTTFGEGWEDWCDELLDTIRSDEDPWRPTARALLRRAVLDPEADTVFNPLTLYQLRDRIFRYSPGGRRAIDLFFGFIDNLADTSAASPDAYDLALDWFLGWQPLFRRLIDGRGDTVTITAGHVQLLIDYVASLRESATTTELLDSLELQEARLDMPSWVGLDMNEWLEAINVLSCEPSDTVLCLKGGRFRVEAEWLTDKGVQGHGQAVQLTSDTGYFWFFDPANVEVVAKAIRGCGFPQDNPLRNFWFFAAGLTDVDVLLTVTDTGTGEVQEYSNPQKTKFLPIQDTAAFPTCDAPELPQGDSVIASWDLPYPPIPRQAEEVSGFLERAVDAAKRLLGFDSSVSADSLAGRGAAGTCVEDATSLCLNDDRFKVTATWETVGGDAGSGQAVELTDDTGYFWFFDDANVEVVIKTLDACGFRQGNPLRNFWVFAAGLTDVEVDLTVEDTLTGDIQVYHNNQKTQFQPIQDTSAFPTCDAM